MVTAKPLDPQLPRVLIFGYREFSQQVSSLLAEFDTRAEFKIIDFIVDSFAGLRSHIGDFDPDVVVSAGSNAAYLKSALNLPVVSLEVTESDIADAVTKAAAVTDNILMISFEPLPRILPHLENSLGVSITHKRYRTPEEAREIFYIASKQSWGAIVGASFICGLATQEGFKSFLFYSRESSRQMLLKAIEAGAQYRRARHGQALCNWLMENSNTPVLVVGSDARLLQFNRAAGAGLQLDTATGADAAELIKSLRLAPASGGECRINGCDWWFHRDELDSGLGESGFSKSGFGESVQIYQLYRKKLNLDQAPSRPAAAGDELRYRSGAMAAVMRSVESFSHSPSNILITGESGTGKELIARAIHQASPFAAGQFVGVNCGAIPSELFEGELFGHREGAYTGSRRGGRKGLIEAAGDGLLFLDEIGELTLEQQAKLLRFLQERTVRRLGGNKETQINLKIVAASNRPLREMVQQKTFREDLFYRLNVFHIQLPPLRARKDDIDCIAESKLEQFLGLYNLNINAGEVLEQIGPALREYCWPGNVRELENVLERIVANLLVSPDTGSASALLHSIAPELFAGDTLPAPVAGSPRQRELQLVARAMDRFDNDKHKVAEYLGISQTTLWRRLKQLNKSD